MATDSVLSPRFGFFVPRVLSITDVPFDQLRVISSGSEQLGASFVGFDSVTVEATGPGSSYCTSTPTSLGTPAQISATGTSSCHANHLSLQANPVPGGFGLFFYGPVAIQNPFGNGVLCTASATRLPIEQTSGSALIHALDLSEATPELLPGSTWYFQAWFRDPQSQGSAFNLSDGLEVDFTP